MNTSIPTTDPPLKVLIVALTALALGSPISAAEDRRDEDRQSPVIRAGVDLVVVPVTVADRHGKTVTGLERTAFTVFDRDQPQQIASFSTEDVPCSIGIVLDTSGSMKSTAKYARRSIRVFLDTLHPDDEISLLTVSDRPRLQFDFSTEISRIESNLLFSPFGGSTALLDSLRFALEHMRGARNGRRVLLVVSDGRDNKSRFSKRELMQFAVESDIQIYTVGIAEVPRTKHQVTEDWQGIRLLEDLAYATGGLHYRIREPNDLEIAAARIGRAMHDQYLITYYSPPRSAGGKWRKIEVKVADPSGHPLRVLARRRYLSPNQ